MSGILAVWNNCAPGAELDYERWYVREHLPERLRVAGFRRGWRYKAQAADPRYFTYYEVDEPEVLLSKPYLERLENPTPWTERIMASAFRDTSRTVCKVVLAFGATAGAQVVNMRWEGPANTASLIETAQELYELDGVTRVQVWNAATTQTPKTKEISVRGKADAMIGGALVADCISESNACIVSTLLANKVSRDVFGMQQTQMIGTYLFSCMLQREDKIK